MLILVKRNLISGQKKNSFLIGDLLPEINKTKFHNLDLSIGSNWLGTKNEIEDLDFFQFKIEKTTKDYT